MDLLDKGGCIVQIASRIQTLWMKKGKQKSGGAIIVQGVPRIYTLCTQRSRLYATFYVKIVAWVASAMSGIPYTYSQHYSSTVSPVYYMSRATLMRYWGK